MKIYYITAFVALFSIIACRKKMDVQSVSSFGVTSDSTSYSAGNTTNFIFTGNPDNITFFSGEVGHRYQYRNRVSAAGSPIIQFTSALNAGVQAGSLHLMVSNNFNGIVVGDSVTTKANIAAANWTDITSRATLATNATAVASGPIVLSDTAFVNRPVFIAFKYVATSGSIQNKWTISALTVTNTLPDASVYTIANLVANNTAITTNYGGASTFSPGWVPYPVANTYNWVVTAGTSLVITGATTAALATANAESWVLMGSLDLTKVTPDVGVAIKSINAALAIYPYVYGATGSYTATFTASNVNRDAADSVQKTLPITIK